MSHVRKPLCGLLLGAFALLLTGSVVLATPVSAAATVRISNARATPYYVSRYAAPKRVTISYTLSGHTHVTIVVQQAGHTVKTVLNRSGKNTGAHSSSWTLKKSSGAWAAAGKYTIKISARDAKGHKSRPYPATVYCYIDNTAPTVAISGVSTTSISPSLGEVTTVTYRLSDNVQSAALYAALELLDSSGAVVRSVAAAGVAQGSGRTFEWDGLASDGAMAPAGTYSTRVRVADLAGNVRVSASGPSIQVRGGEWSRDRALDARAYTELIMRSATRGDLTHVVWNDGSVTGDRIRYRRLDRFGNTVVAPLLVATSTLDLGSDTRGIPDVAGDPSGGAYVVWRGVGRSASFRGIWIAHIDAAGRMLWKRMVLSETNTTYDILDPRVAVSSNGLAHVVCWKEGGPNAIYYATFRSDGNEDIGWTALASGTTSGQRKMPNIEIDGSGRVHVAWYDAIDHPGTSNVGHREIYYTRLVYAAGHVANSIDRARLTTTVEGYSPEYYDAPEMAVDTAGSLHLAWPDKTSATTSNGIRYLRLDDNGTVAVASMVAFDGSVSSPGPRAGRNQAIAVQPGGGARIVCTARAGISSPYRLWQVDVSAAGTAGTPLCITDSGGRTASTAEDAFASLGTDSRGVMHLVYAADSGVPLQQATQQRVTYRDFAADPASNDVTRGDLEIDAAHVVHASTPAPPRQNTPVIVQAEIRNAGWAPMLGGTATLWFEGAPVDVEAIPGLSVEETCAVPLHWTVPDDATRTPAALRVSVAPLAETPQTSSANDSAAVPMSFQIPPTATALIVEVLDETYDEYRAGKYIVPTSTVTLSGTTADGRPYTTTGERVSYRTEFYGVPLGTYTVSHAAPGYIISSPASRAVSITRDPGDRYRLITTPSTHLQLWANRWGTIEGAVTESGGATPVVGVELTLLETGETTTTPPGGLFRYDHLCEGPVTMKVKKVGYERQVIATDVVAATTLDLDVSLVPTTTGYLVGTVTDDGGYAVSGATMKVSRTGFPEQTFSLPDGRFDVRLPGTVSGLTYNLAFSAPGYLPNNDVTAKVVAGEEVDPGAGLALDVRSLTHTKGPERWVAPWTMKANWFGGGFDSGGVELESFDIMQWYGLFRFTFDADYQRAGLDDYIRYVKPKFVGEMFSWTYLWGVDPPNAPKVFKYEQDLAGLYDDRFQPPMLNPKATANRTGVRIDGLDIIDQRTGTVVANVRSSWNSCDSPDGHLYGTEEGGTAGDGQFRYGSVPFDQQVVRLWITVGQMNADGHFEGATFGDIGRFNQGELLQATGYNQLQLFWRPADDYLWVEPALVGYPNP